MAWVVVKFTELEVELVPYKWLKGENECWWPPFKKTALEKSIKSCLDPSNDWELHSCTIMSKIFDKFSVATAIATKAQYSSDIEVVNETLPERRKVKKNRKFILNDSEEEQELEEYINSQTKSDSEEEREESEISNFPALEKFKRLERKNGKDNSLPKGAVHINQIEEELPYLPVIRKSPLLDKKTGQNINSQNIMENVPNFDVQAQIKQMVSLLIKNNNLLKNLTQEVDEVKNIINDISLKVNGNVCHSTNNTVNDFSMLQKLFPIENDENLEKIETQLSEEDVFKTMVIKLSRIGGDTTRESVRRIMNKIIHYKFAKMYSWIGHKGKRNFSKLNLAKAVIGAVELTHSSVTEKIVEETIAKWLAKAPEKFKAQNVNI